MSASSTTALPSGLQAALMDAIREGIESGLRQRSNPSPTKDLQPEFFTIAEARHVLAISRSGIYRLFKTLELTPINRGGRVLIDRAQVMDYADKLRKIASRKSMRGAVS